MKIWIPAFCFCLVCAGCQSNGLSTSDRISRYSDSDEAGARAVMDETCAQSDRASRDLLLRAKAVNAALDGKKSSDEIAETMKPLKPTGTQTNSIELEAACDRARATYMRILTVRADAANRAAELSYERAMRDSKIDVPINCISRQSFGTIHTTCQ